MSRLFWQWSLTQIGAPQAWKMAEGDGALVAVLDTGVDARHIELAGKVLPGRNILSPRHEAGDDNGHGTAVAAIVAGQGAGHRGFRGVAPLARILPVKCNEPHTGHVRASNIAEGIRFALDAGADVLNLSVGCALDEPGFGVKEVALLANAIAEALRRGAVVVCAAGPREEKTFPAAWTELVEFEGLLAVGATDHRDRLHWWSPRRSYVSLHAPACATTAFPTWHPRPYNRFGGTSAASPHVAGVAALLKGLQPDLTPREIQRLLLATADPIAGHRFLRVNAQRAVAAVKASMEGEDLAIVAARSTARPTAKGKVIAVSPRPTPRTWSTPQPHENVAGSPLDS